jgi:hypothetical protein
MREDAGKPSWATMADIRGKKKQNGTQKEKNEIEWQHTHEKK